MNGEDGADGVVREVDWRGDYVGWDAAAAALDGGTTPATCRR